MKELKVCRAFHERLDEPPAPNAELRKTMQALAQWEREK
nr:DUF1778 domain-containing protein [Leminorella grimontii]